MAERTKDEPTRPKRRPEASRLAQKIGMAPGSAVYTGDMLEGATVVTCIHFDAGGVTEVILTSEQPMAPADQIGVSWWDLVGLSDLARMAQVQQDFEIHPLTVEDILNVSTPAKAEEIDGRVFVVVPVATLREGVGPLEKHRGGPQIEYEHLSILVGPGWVLTFQEQPGDVFEPLRQRIRTGAGRTRSRGADYLLHAICDSIVDGYFVILEAFEEQVIALEEQAVGEGTDGELPHKVHLLNARLHAFRRRIWPVISAVTALLHVETPLIEPRTEPFFRDVNDHARQAVEILDGARDRLNAVLQLHLALQDNRMNEVMRLLTVVATIFIPLTFVSGVYGMNFRVMPELQWAWGYPVVLGSMALIASAMVVWFRLRKWL